MGDVLVNSPGPAGITDMMREAARAAAGGWLYVVDPHLDAAAQVAPQGLIGAWPVDDDGEIGAEYRGNPGYSPSPAARGWPAPSDDLDRTAQLAAAGYATLDDVCVELLHHEIAYLAAEDGTAERGDGGRIAVYSTGHPGAGRFGSSGARSTGRMFALRAEPGADIVVNPGPWQVVVPAVELAARAIGEASGDQLAERVEEFVDDELDGAALHEAFRSAQVFCLAAEQPGLLAVGDPPGGYVPVFTSLVELARFAGQAPWLSTLGQEVLDLLPDGYDVVLDAGTPRAVRLSLDPPEDRG